MGRNTVLRGRTVVAVLLSTVACLGVSATAKATSIVVSPTFAASNQAAFPDTTDYEGVFYDGVTMFPPSSIPIGTFNFTIPTGDNVVGGTISGTFGDVNYSTTTLTDLYVAGLSIEVASCDDFSDPCAAGTVDGSLVAWSYTFSATDLHNLAADFAAGSLDFTAVQNIPFGAVVVGTPILDLQAVPEPATLATLAGGLLALVALRRRK